MSRRPAQNNSFTYAFTLHSTGTITKALFVHCPLSPAAEEGGDDEFGRSDGLGWHERKMFCELPLPHRGQQHERGLRTNFIYDLATKLFGWNKQKHSLVDSVGWLYFFEGLLVSAKFTSKMSQTNPNKEFTMTKEVRIIFTKTSCWNCRLPICLVRFCWLIVLQTNKTIQANVDFQQKWHVKYTLWSRLILGTSQKMIKKHIEHLEIKASAIIACTNKIKFC